MLDVRVRNLCSALAQVSTTLLHVLHRGSSSRVSCISWVNADPYNPIVRAIYSVTEPVLYRIRRALPVLRRRHRLLADRRLHRRSCSCRSSSCRVCGELAHAHAVSRGGRVVPAGAGRCRAPARNALDAVDARRVLRVQLTAPPVEGAANRALIDAPGRALGVERGDLEVVRGDARPRQAASPSGTARRPSSRRRLRGSAGLPR